MSENRPGPKVVLRWLCRWALLEQVLQGNPTEAPFSLRKGRKLLDVLFEVSYSLSLVVTVLEEVLEQKKAEYGDEDWSEQLGQLMESKDPYKFVGNLSIAQALQWVQGFDLGEVVGLWKTEFRRYAKGFQGSICPLIQYRQEGQGLLEIYDLEGWEQPRFDERKRWNHVHPGPLVRQVKSLDQSLSLRLARQPALSAAEVLCFMSSGLQVLVLDLLGHWSVQGKASTAAEGLKHLDLNEVTAILDADVYPRHPEPVPGALLQLGTVHYGSSTLGQFAAALECLQPLGLEVLLVAVKEVGQTLGYGEMSQLLPATALILTRNINPNNPLSGDLA